jgi:outer membrane protein assembly factor BamB
MGFMPATTGAVRLPAQRSCPAVAQGTCYLSVDHKLLALNAMSQEVLWEYPTGGPIPGSPTFVANQGIRVHSSDRHLHCVDTQGKARWQPVHVGQPLGWASPVVDEAGNTWISAYTGGLIKVDGQGRTSGKLFLRSFTKFDSTGVIYNGFLYLGGEDACVHAIGLDGERGTQSWDHEGRRGRTGWFINSALAFGPGPTLVVASHDNQVHFFSLDGQALGAVTLAGEILGSPIVGPDFAVYVGVSDTRRAGTGAGSLVCIDGKERRVLWAYAAAGPVESTPVLGNDGIVYFGDNAGVIHAVDRSGKACWTESVPAPVRSPGTVIWNERLAFGLDDGRVAVLQCSSKGLAKGWPKFLGTAGQSGVAPQT